MNAHVRAMFHFYSTSVSLLPQKKKGGVGEKCLPSETTHNQQSEEHMGFFMDPL